MKSSVNWKAEQFCSFKHVLRLIILSSSMYQIDILIMMLKLLIFILYFITLVSTPSRAEANSQRLERILDRLQGGDKFSSIDYDVLHKSIVLDQIESYIRPIKSLNTREIKSLNGLYDFCFDPDLRGFDSRWHEQSLVDSCPGQNFHRMPVPSAFNDIQAERDYMGWMWYQTVLPWPTSVDCDTRSIGANWLIQFDSINYMSVIWVQVIPGGGAEFPVKNYPSKLVGAHVGGHLPVVVNISSVINGEHDHCHEWSELRLTIAVSNILNENTIPSGQMLNMTSVVGRPYYKFQPDFDFFHFAGIMGDVQFIKLPSVYIEKVSQIELVDRIDGTQHVDLELCLNSRFDDIDESVVREGSRDYKLTYSLASSTYTVIDSSVGSSYRHDNDQLNLSNTMCQTLILCPNRDCNLREHFVVWPPVERGCDDGNRSSCLTGRQLERPKSIRFQLIVNHTLDTGHHIEYDTFELKLILRANMSRILADERGPKQLQGFGMHHEQLFSGRTMSLAAIMKDLNLLKQMGANVLRTSHYPYSRAYLSACDELGIMVIAECPAVGLKSFGELKLKFHQQILLEMMERDHEHPSIVMWSVANEPESQQAVARDYFKQLLQFARDDLASFTTQAGRPMTAAIAQSHVDDKIGDLLDVIMINRYYGWYDYPGVLEAIRAQLEASLNGWAQKYGANKPLILSEFGADTLAGFHSSFPGQLFTEEYQRDLIVEYEKVFDLIVASNKTQINFLGAMIWNFADFSTHESLLRVHGNRKGIFTRDREPKLAAESVKQIFKSRLSRVKQI